MRDSAGYSERLSPEDQVDAEEAISEYLYGYQTQMIASDDSPDETLTVEDCNDLGRALLKLVLERFRPDLFDPEAPDA